MFFKKYGDIVVGVFFMVLSACLIAMAQMLPKSKVMEIGPDFMPMVIGVVTFILAGPEHFRYLVHRIRKRWAAGETDLLSGPAGQFSRKCKWNGTGRCNYKADF